MRKHISTIIAGIIFLTGLSLLLYPTISNFWNSKHQTQAVADYSKQIEKMDDQEKEQALAAAEKYNQTLITNGGRFTPSEEEDTLYDSLLDANGTGMMGWIYHNSGNSLQASNLSWCRGFCSAGWYRTY